MYTFKLPVLIIIRNGSSTKSYDSSKTNLYKGLADMQLKVGKWGLKFQITYN